jgi:hypothetical protein
MILKTSFVWQLFIAEPIKLEIQFFPWKEASLQ